jgi:hypothetical protein
MLAFSICALLWQDPAPSPPAPAPEAAQAQATPRAEPWKPEPKTSWDDRAAKSAIDEYTKSLKTAGSMADRSKALEALVGGSNKLLVRPLAQVVETDKSVVLKRRAAELLASQPADAAAPVLVRLVKSSKVDQHATVQGALIRSLAHCGYKPDHWQQLDSLFEQQYHVERVAVQEAILDLVAAHKEKQALDMLLRNLDEPIPENVDDASNPPKEYWEMRWKSWRVWRTKVKDALFAITGQRFSTAQEAKDWLKKNPIK